MRKIIAFIILLMFVFSAAALAADSRWTVVKSNNDSAFFIDSKTVAFDKFQRSDKPGDKIITCWTRVSILTDELESRVKQKVKSEYPEKNLDLSNLSYMLWKWHFDTQSDECYEEMVIYYDANGKEIFREPIKQNWCVIEPESVEEVFYNAAKTKLNIK